MHDVLPPAAQPMAPRSRWNPLRLSRPPLSDAALAAAFVVLSVAEAFFSAEVSEPATHLLAAGVASAALAWRRQVPILVAVVLVGTNTVINPSGQFSTVLALVLVSYTVGSETRPPQSYVGLAVMLVPFLSAMAMAGMVPSDVGAALMFLVGPWAVGTAVRERTRRSAEAVARAERVEREAAAAVEEERTRIARELHDIVSHSISVVTIQTQAVRRRLPPEQAREIEDLRRVEATAREALAEMRRLFGVLRGGQESVSLTPQPGLEQVPRLLEQVAAAGVDVRHTETGEPRELSPGTDLAAYRILQEALTNVLRHSGARSVAVLVSHTPDQLELVVEDDGRGLPDEPRDGGHGLIGLRERVSVYGGTLSLGPGATGGVRLVATLPLRESA